MNFCSAFVCKFFLCISLVSLSAVAYALSDVKTRVLQSGSGFQVKEINYRDEKRLSRTTQLYFIESPDGALNASRKAELPEKELFDLIRDYGGKRKCVSQIKKDKKLRKIPKKLPKICRKEFRKQFRSSKHFNVMIIDKDAVMISNQKDMNRLMSSKGMSELMEEFKSESQTERLVNPTDIDVRGCWGWTSKSKVWSKSFKEYIGRDKNFSSSGGNSFLDVNIGANLSGNGNANLHYRYKRTWCVPYKIEIGHITAKASFDLVGDIQIMGQAKHSFSGLTWNIASPTIANGWFFIGPIPVKYNVELPIRAGTGDIHLKVSGEVGLQEKLSIKGYYEYRCDRSSCRKVRSSITDNGTLHTDNLSYNVMATIDIEPFVDVAIEADMYWRLIWAKVGIRPSLPVSITGYYGNQCEDGDGQDGNEIVKAAYFEVKLRAGVFYQIKWSTEKYFEIYKANLLVQDILNPSTAFSPVIRSTVNTMTVTLLMHLRTCVSHVDKKYQDFKISWGDGLSSNTYDLTGTKTFLHSYTKTGIYTIQVRHKNGASTKNTVAVGITLSPTITPTNSLMPTFSASPSASP